MRTPETDQIVDDMPLEVFSKWIALLEAVSIVSEECTDRSMDFEEINLEPLYIKKFVDTRSDQIHQQFEIELNKPQFCTV